MKIFFSEGDPDYSSYTFNYGVYALKEDEKDLAEIYTSGFLPYTGNPQLQYDIFYLARSLRVDLERFADTSENRRVQRKIEPLGITMSISDKKEMLAKDTTCLDFCWDYAQERIGDSMPRDRFDYIFSRPTGTHIFRFQHNNNPVGYVLACIYDKTLHYWFSFFDTQLMKTHSLGKWMMWKVISWGNQQQLEHVYLGTCYGNKSLYKVRDHKGLSFFDGIAWNPDMKLLKEWCKSDDRTGGPDRLKSTSDLNSLIARLSKG